MRLVKELGLPVEFIVLPTFAYEHKIFLGPFARSFPDAKVWIAPRWGKRPALPRALFYTGLPCLRHAALPHSPALYMAGSLLGIS